MELAAYLCMDTNNPLVKVGVNEERSRENEKTGYPNNYTVKQERT